MSHTQSVTNYFALRVFQTRMLSWLFVVFCSSALLACGGGGGSVSAPIQASESTTNVEASVKLQASDLKNLTIASFDPASTQWLVRAVIGERYFDNQNGSGVALTSIPRFAKICAEGPSPCQFDTYSVGKLADGTIVESVTAFGKWWNFDMAGNEFAESNKDLKSVPRFANGPCLQALQTNTPCRFDSHSFGVLNLNSPLWVQSITAYGRGYNFDSNLQPFAGNGFDFKSISRFAQGPCADVPAVAPCQFTARTFHEVPVGAVDGASWLEWILRDGRIWVFDTNGQPRDPNSYQRTTSTAGTPADQVNLLNVIFSSSGNQPQTPVIKPGLESQLYTCNVRDSVDGVGTDPLTQQAITFYQYGRYQIQAYDAARVYPPEPAAQFKFNDTDGAIRFLNGYWGTNGDSDGQLSRDGTLLRLGTAKNSAPKKIAECVPRPPDYVLVPTPTLPPTTGTSANPLIPDGATSANFKCTIDVRLPLGGGIFVNVKTPAGGTQLNRDGTYSYTSGETGTVAGQYAILAGQQIEFISGFWRTPDGSGRFGSFLSDGGQFLAIWTPAPGSGIRGSELATCLRVGSKSGVDGEPPKTIIKLADEAKACLNYFDANQCEASKLFVSLFGSEAAPSSVAYWAGVPLDAVEKRRMFIETYRGSTTALVTRFYQACLLREPDPQGIINWRSYLEANGATATARIFEASDEAISKGSPCKVEVQ